jgi:hypothetical protein
LNVSDGQLEEVAPSVAEFETAASAPESFDRWFMPEIVREQALLGTVPQEDECLSLQIPPALGGKLERDNIEVADIAVHFSILGQMHQQVRNLRPGTRIDKIEVVEPGREKKPWWRFW